MSDHIRRAPRFAGWALSAALIAACAVSPVQAGSYTAFHDFELADGALPSSLSQDAEGNIYGQTAAGGDSTCSSVGAVYPGCGVIFRITATGTFSVLAIDGTASAGTVQSGAPLLVQGSKLYGTSAFGGVKKSGTVFSLRVGNTQVRILHSFDGNDGAAPNGRIAMDNAGDLYGTTTSGGPVAGSNAGVLYRIAPDGSYTILHNFVSDFANDPGGVVLSKGILYGTTQVSVYSYDTATGAFTTLYNFPAEFVNAYPQLAGIDAQGTLFGFTQGNLEAPYSGTLFEMPKQGRRFGFTTLYTFTPAAGGTSPVGVTLTSTGALVGTTNYGPQVAKQDGFGTVFSFSNGVMSTLFTFSKDAQQNGLHGGGAPVVTTSGAIFGPAVFGGDVTCKAETGGLHRGCGLIFEYQP